MLQLLVLVVIVGAVSGRCPQGKFWSKVLSECVPCQKCTQSYLLRACSPERDSVCADEIRFTLDWLHPSKQTHHLSKDRLSAIKQDLYNTSEDDDEVSEDLPKLDKKKPKHFHFPQEESELKSKHKKHKKHYEFDDTLSDREYKKKDRLQEKWRKKKLSLDDEKALEDWLRVSEDKLKHRKQDLLRTLKHSKSESNEMPSRRLNQPNRKVMSDIWNGLVKHELHRDGASELLAELELANKAHQVREESDEDVTEEEEEQAVRLMHLLASHDSPHRLFPGQPSTVSEIIGQVKEDGGHKSNVVLEKSNRQFVDDNLISESHLLDESVVAEPFSAAEALVWDWQAVALVSAVAACLMFFVIAAIYLLLSARDTKRISSDHDGEEMTTMVALMPPSDEQENHHKPRPIVIAKPGHGLGYIHAKSYTRS